MSAEPAAADEIGQTLSVELSIDEVDFMQNKTDEPSSSSSTKDEEDAETMEKEEAAAAVVAAEEPATPVESEPEKETLAMEKEPAVVEEDEVDELGVTAKLDSSEGSTGGKDDGPSPSPSEGGASAVIKDGFGRREAKRMARNPCKYLLCGLVISIILSALAMTVGDFTVAIDNAGWWSRGTLISNRQTQLMLTDSYKDYLFYGGEEAWEDLLNNVQPGWETPENQADSLDRRLSSGAAAGKSTHYLQNIDKLIQKQRELPFAADNNLVGQMHQQRQRLLEIPRHLIENNTALEGCDTDWYLDWNYLSSESRLWPVWKTTSTAYEFMDTDVFRDLCVAETNTQRVLQEQGLCFGCPNDGCLPPFSVILFARVSLENGFDKDCDELATAWDEYQAEFEQEWVQCVEDMKIYYDTSIGQPSMPESCPPSFHPSFVQDDFDITDWKAFTSSIFATMEDDVDEMYAIVEKYDRGSDKIEGAYDTQREDFGLIFTESVLGSDMALAMGSAVVTVLAMLIHTRSPFLTGIGLLQIILAFPMSYFVYTFIAGLEFFPFLNFIAVFVLFALGADHVFVAVDKWKNARIDAPHADIEEIAATALPDATAAMFLTTVTTAIAFFGTAICPVAPIKMFAIFCGLLISIDYIMCILLIFPALCIYDRSLTSGSKNYCMACHCCHKTEAANEEAEGDLDEEHVEKQSLIRRVLLVYYHYLHQFRFVIFALAMMALALCAWKSTTLELPVSADVRILSEDNEYERSYQWRQELLSTYLVKSGGSEAWLGFGLTPADTGNQNSPESWSQLVLDESFDPSSTDAQIYLRDYCTILYEQDWAYPPKEDYTCPIDDFHAWLGNQTASDTPDDIYTENCAGATGLPMPSESFHSCIIAWSYSVDDTRVLSNEGEVKIIYFDFGSRVRYDSPYQVLDDEWNLIEDWFIAQGEKAPSGVDKPFFSNYDFWWYDTNGQMLSTAYGAAGIALGAAAGVILFSSRSFILTLFSITTIGYVLTSVTAALVGLGWTLGFLESICFAILIGVSVDFVIHFGYAYAKKPGNVSRGERTKYALIRMGPSVLAAAFTSIAAGTVMLFTEITFFQKFALILLMTILQATLGSFVVFLVLTDTVGPAHPTYLVDKMFGKVEEDSSEADAEPDTQKEAEKPSTTLKVSDKEYSV